MTITIWKERTKTILWAIWLYVLLLVAGAIFNLADSVGILSAIRDSGSPERMLEAIMSVGTPGIEDIIVEVLLFGSFIWMTSAVKDFASAQDDMQTRFSLERVSGALWLNFVASVVAMLPYIGWLVSLVMYIVSYSRMMSAFRNLMQSPVFDVNARSAAGTLKSYSVWSIWGLFIGLCNIPAWIQFLRGWSKMHGGAPVEAVKTPEPAPRAAVPAPEAEVSGEYIIKVKSKTDDELKELIRQKEDYNPLLVKAAEQVLLERLIHAGESRKEAVAAEAAEPAAAGAEEPASDSEQTDLCHAPVSVVEPEPAPEAKPEPAPAQPSPTAKPAQQPVGAPAGGSGSNVKAVVAVVVAVLVLAGGALTYFLWYVPYAKDRDALRTYVLATNVFLRSSQMAGVEYNILDKIPYGSELITYEKGTEWASVKVNGRTGFMASPYLLTREDFGLLNGVWGDADSRECIASSKCRLAILHYFKEAGLASGVQGCQIYTKARDQKPNSVFYPRIYDRGSKFTDFVFIVKDNATADRRLVCYSFDDETELPIFRFVTAAPADGYIKNVKNSGELILVTFDNGETLQVVR